MFGWTTWCIYIWSGHTADVDTVSHGPAEEPVEDKQNPQTPESHEEDEDEDEEDTDTDDGAGGEDEDADGSWFDYDNNSRLYVLYQVWRRKNILIFTKV